MELWTEYEGTVVDGAFPLKKLLRPEGRSAFYSTSNGKGEPTVIRLVASHFDEEEILARWCGVTALAHPNILKLEHYGQLELDDTTVVYAVMEPVDANLEEVLAGQRLTVAEARQLAGSLASALDALHAHGFVHEHVESANVFAVGEEVKLRSDCIREAPEGDQGRDAKRGDVHDLAVVILQALTQKRSLAEAARDLPIPAPFDLIVAKGLSGTWGLAEILSALEMSAPKIAQRAIPMTAAVQTAAPVIDHGVLNGSGNGAGSGTGNETVNGTGLKATSLNGSLNGSSGTVTESDSAGASVPAADLKSAAMPSGTGESVSTEAEPVFSSRISGRSAGFQAPGEGVEGTVPVRKLLAGLGVGLLLVLLLVWYFAHGKSSAKARTQAGSPVAGQGNGGQSGSPAVPSPVVGHAAKPSAAAGRSTKVTVTNVTAAHNDTAGVRSQWRVVAFTYNHEDQARKKVESVAKKYPRLSPQVFSPSGHAPYLVALGGAMSRDEAFALAQRARTMGLPRDLYAQNYTGRK